MSSSPSSPQLSSPLWQQSPSAPGVYIFKNASDRLLYVGKAKNLKTRIRSYFRPPTALGPKTASLVSQISSISFIQVQSEIEALLLESRLIKKFQPPYNISARDDTSPYFIHITEEPYPKPTINHNRYKAIAGPFLNRLIPTRILRQLRRVAPYCTSPRPVKKPCFYSHLGLCHPCPATGDSPGYLQNIFRLKKLLRGHFHSVSTDLKKTMADLSRNQQYEKAAALKTALQALNHLRQTPISPDEYLVNPNLVSDLNQLSANSLRETLTQHSTLNIKHLHRIEFYDNSHLSGTHPASAMTVAIDGQVTSRRYRRFNLKNTSGDDVALMAEVLSRRLTRSDWPQPDLIVLDGGLPQLSIVQMLNAKCQMPNFIALAKREETIYFLNSPPLKLPHRHPGLQLLMRLRDEAHRFSRRLHHYHRSKKMLN